MSQFGNTVIFMQLNPGYDLARSVSSSGANSRGETRRSNELKQNQ
jgi:hypothetical protein